jgi:hypothetical protein
MALPANIEMLTTFEGIVQRYPLSELVLTTLALASPHSTFENY